MMIKLARCFSLMFDWARRHPAKAATILFLSWLPALMVHAKFTEHDRFNASFEITVWNWSQAGEHPQALDAQEPRELIEQLFSAEPPERWSAAGKLAGWRGPTALLPLVAAMLGDGRKGREFRSFPRLRKLADRAAGTA